MTSWPLDICSIHDQFYIICQLGFSKIQAELTNLPILPKSSTIKKLKNI